MDKKRTNSLVLVGVLNRQKDLENVLKEHWYRIPAKYAPRRQPAYLAFYQTHVFGAVEVIRYTDKRGKSAEKAARIRLAITVNSDEKSIEKFLLKNVEEGSMIRTDGWRRYSKTALSNYGHKQTPGMRAAHIHRAFGNLKTWLNGTHHDEFAREKESPGRICFDLFNS